MVSIPSVPFWSLHAGNATLSVTAEKVPTCDIEPRELPIQVTPETIIHSLYTQRKGLIFGGLLLFLLGAVGWYCRSGNGVMKVICFSGVGITLFALVCYFL